MSDADLIYNACLRAERRLEEMIERAPYGDRAIVRSEVSIAMDAIRTLREEIGNGLSRESR